MASGERTADLRQEFRAGGGFKNENFRRSDENFGGADVAVPKFFGRWPRKSFPTNTLFGMNMSPNVRLAIANFSISGARSWGREARNRRTMRLAIAAGIVLIIGAGSIHLSRRAADGSSTPPIANEVTPSQPNQPPQAGSQSPVLSAVLNLESESITRSPGGSPTIAGELQRIPRGRLALSIYLPTGSEAGQYDVQVLTTVSDQTPLVTSSGTAAIENGLTILRIAPDLSTLDPATYILSIRRGTGPWRYYRFALS